MRKKLLMAFVALMSVSGVMAQNDDFCRHEVAVSYGAASNSQWINAFEHITTVAVTFGGVKYENEEYTGPFSVEYFYHPSKMIGLGGIFVYGKNSQDVMSGSTKIDELTQAYYTLMPAAKFNWYNSKCFGAYSKLGAGVTLRSEKYGDESDNVLHFNWQVSLIGLEVGSRQIRAFGELGVGEQGIILGGVRCKF